MTRERLAGPELQEVANATRAYRRARAIRDEAIAEAAVIHGGDDTAFYAGLSPTRVRQIVRELRRQGWTSTSESASEAPR
jgi:hypothetical protein